MAKTVLSVDIGSTSVKALLVKKTFGEQTVEGFELFPRTNRGEEEIDRILQTISSDPRFKADVMVSSLPGDWISTRFLSLPFKEESKIEAVGPFELEGEIPFDLEELLVDFHKIVTHDGQTDLLAFAVSKEKLRKRLELFQRNGIEPRILSVESVALSNLACWMGQRSQPIALVEIGASKTSICILNGLRMELVRTIRFGGEDLSATLAQDWGISVEEAEIRKCEEIDLLMESEGSSLAKEVLVPWLVEVRRTFREYRVHYGREVGIIYLGGGGSRLKGLVPYLSERLDRIVEPLQLNARVPQMGFIDSEKEAFFASSLAAVGQAVFRGRPSQINMRKGEFEFESEMKEIRGKMIDVGALLGVLVLFMVYQLFAGYFTTKARYESLRKEVRATFQSTFPEVQTIVSPIDQMRQKTQELREKVLAQGGDRVTVIDVIREISEAIPPEVLIDVTDLTIDGNKVRLKGRTDTIEAVDQIKGTLSPVPWFKDVAVTNTQVTFDKEGFEFQMTWSLGGAQ